MIMNNYNLILGLLITTSLCFNNCSKEEDSTTKKNNAIHSKLTDKEIQQFSDAVAVTHTIKTFASGEAAVIKNIITIFKQGYETSKTTQQNSDQNAARSGKSCKAKIALDYSNVFYDSFSKTNGKIEVNSDIVLDCLPILSNQPGKLLSTVSNVGLTGERVWSNSNVVFDAHIDEFNNSVLDLKEIKAHLEGKIITLSNFDEFYPQIKLSNLPIGFRMNGILQGVFTFDKFIIHYNVKTKKITIDAKIDYDIKTELVGGFSEISGNLTISIKDNILKIKTNPKGGFIDDLHLVIIIDLNEINQETT